MRKISLIIVLMLPAMAFAKPKGKAPPLPARVAAQVGAAKLTEQMVVTTVALAEVIIGGQLSEAERNQLADATVATFKGDAATQAASGAAVVELYELLAHATDADAVTVTRERLRNAVQLANPAKYKVLLGLVQAHAPALAADAGWVVMPDDIAPVVQSNDAVSKMSGKKYVSDAAQLTEKVKTSFASFSAEDKERYAFAVTRNMALGDGLEAMTPAEKQTLANWLGKSVKIPDDVPNAARDLEQQCLAKFYAAHPLIATHEAVAKRIDFLTGWK
jgi:hypothetical protein